MPTRVNIFGVRHHGPGSARSLVSALEALKPDCLLIEGPPEGDSVLEMAAHPKTRPPVALLVYAPDQPRWSAFYPFAAFSPEWQAIRYALRTRTPVRFMDLPMTYYFALEQQQLEALEAKMKAAASNAPAASADHPEASGGESDGEADDAFTPCTDGSPPVSAGQNDAPSSANADAQAEGGGGAEPEAVAGDPLQYLAEAAGYPDGELWWDHVVEHRQTPGGVFAAILEAMTSLRQAAPQVCRPEDVRREAWMRKTIRAAMKEGCERIAVVCGAWHAPALVESAMPSAKEDDALLKDLPKLKTAAAWVPWSYGRLCFASGYGAGIHSPGWYHHLFTGGQSEQEAGKLKKNAVLEPAVADASTLAVTWLTKVARLLRQEDLDASSAHIIETVRLAEALAAIRQRSVVSLNELNEAIRTVLLFGDDTSMCLIHDKLIVSERLGEVPDEGILAPLQLDVQRQQKRLRLPPDAAQKILELDLRKPNDLERSQLLHRLSILGIPWGTLHEGAGGKGTFKEIWQTQWEPEYAVRVIEAGIWGNSIYDAATGFVRRLAGTAASLPTVTDLLDRCLPAALPEAVRFLMKRVETLAAVAADVTHMMAAVPSLAGIVRYGNVRKTDTSMVTHVVDGLMARIIINLPGACASLNDQAAAEMEEGLSRVHAAVQLLYPASRLQQEGPEGLGMQWTGLLRQLADQSGLHGLLAGRVVRLLLDGGHFSSDEAARHMFLALSIGADPPAGAAWVEGFLKGSGLLLLHDDNLWSVLDRWVTAMPADDFTRVLPLLRRSFSQFPAPERQQMGQRVKKTAQPTAPHAAADSDLDESRAAQIFPVLRQVMGLP